MQNEISVLGIGACISLVAVAANAFFQTWLFKRERRKILKRICTELDDVKFPILSHFDLTLSRYRQELPGIVGELFKTDRVEYEKALRGWMDTVNEAVALPKEIETTVVTLTNAVNSLSELLEKRLPKAS